MLYLRDLLPVGKKVTIEYRCNAPLECSDTNEDMLFGFAIWDGEKLNSGDGDNYYLGDVVMRYEWNYDDYLIIWIEVTWSSSRKESPIFL